MRKRYQIKKIGHAGTLDPLAEGVMIVLTGKDTKIQNQFMKLDKTYQAEIVFGATTPSLDLETPLTYDENFKPKTLSQVEGVLKELVGEIEMPVPIYSAKKIAGKRLYKYARAKARAMGKKNEVDSEKDTSVDNEIEIELPFIKSKIYEIYLLSFDEVIIEGRVLQKITIKVKCESGTYIRALSKLIGERLQTQAFLFHLLRTSVGDFHLSESQKFDELELV